MILLFPALLTAQLANDDWVLTQKTLNELSQSNHLKKSFVSYAVAEVGNKDRHFFSSLSSKLMRPASCLKVLTAWHGYKVLGKDYQFTTTLAYNGTLRNGLLIGDIIIEGSGDPTLGSNYNPATKNLDQLLKSWVTAISSAGIEKIDGDIIIIEPERETEMIPDTWSWDDIGNYYGTAAYQVNINENSYVLSLERNEVEGQVIERYRIVPRSPYLDFVQLTVKEGPEGSGDQAYIYGSPFSFERSVRGSVPTGRGVYNIKGSLPSPGLHLGFWLKEELALQGISCNSIKTQPSTFSDTVILNKTLSPSADKIIKYLLHKSNNLYAEALLSSIADGDKSGLESLTSYMKSIGVAEEDIALYDGSGLSNRNLISAESFVMLLIDIAQDEKGEEFIDLLPSFGRDGTLKYMMRGKSAASYMKGKSGSIGSVLTYVGYFYKDGKRFAFAIMIDHWNGENYSMIKSQIESLLESTFVDIY